MKWVSVEEGLPQPFVPVLVVYGRDTNCMAVAWLGPSPRGWESEDYECNTYAISHWMPLPEAPSEEK